MSSEAPPAVPELHMDCKLQQAAHRWEQEAEWRLEHVLSCCILRKIKSIKRKNTKTYRNGEHLKKRVILLSSNRQSI